MSEIPQLESALREAEKVALVTVLRSHPEWTLGEVLEYLDQGGARALALRGLTLRELLTEPDAGCLSLPDDDGPVIDVARLERAKRVRAEAFDQLVEEVLTEAGRPVGAGYLRARVGGPRWKLQGALRRLVAAKVVVRTGSTSATLYQYAGRR
ncbi:hypothetical protein ENSA5_16220 [Enhygromyxa salina]|uniref:Uncharacterized protein n=2 Tax=Enhygromyxa salina TaxID=215803 RepID=A0A2S9YEI4_9BACT|nr:hypothetical protein ENSA5_16220 [Enhygromyxa salina]